MLGRTVGAGCLLTVLYVSMDVDAIESLSVDCVCSLALLADKSVVMDVSCKSMVENVRLVSAVEVSRLNIVERLGIVLARPELVDDPDIVLVYLLEIVCIATVIRVSVERKLIAVQPLPVEFNWKLKLHEKDVALHWAFAGQD